MLTENGCKLLDILKKTQELREAEVIDTIDVWAQQKVEELMLVVRNANLTELDGMLKLFEISSNNHPYTGRISAKINKLRLDALEKALGVEICRHTEPLDVGKVTYSSISVHALKSLLQEAIKETSP